MTPLYTLAVPLGIVISVVAGLLMPSQAKRPRCR